MILNMQEHGTTMSAHFVIHQYTYYFIVLVVPLDGAVSITKSTMDQTVLSIQGTLPLALTCNSLDLSQL